VSGAGDAGEPAGPPKEDPGTLVLRGRPRPVTRFRRGLVIALSAGVASALVGLAWAALEPVSLTRSGTVIPAPSAQPSHDAIAGAPATYAAVPQLGPPLPGDLGRAIVARERGSGQDDEIQADGNGSAVAGDESRAAGKEARSAPVLVRLSRPVQPDAGGGAQADGTKSASQLSPEQASRSGSQGSRQRRMELDGGEAVLERAGSPWTLAAGTIIPASLLTGLDSDLPGLVVAQVTADVRDSATGRRVLIPRGSRLLGQYDSRVAFGQQRAFLAWNRLVLPDGSSVGLGEMPATDAAGYSGLGDGVDFHEGRLLKGILLSSVLGVGSELGYGGDDRELVRALRQSAQANGSRAGEQIVSRDLEIQPTLTVRPGWPVRAILHKDLVLEPWSGQ